MTIPRANPAGWGTNEKLTSALMNAVDINTTWALDKRSGQTDTLASTITVTGALTVQSVSTFTGASSFAGTVTYGALSAVTFSGAVTYGAASVITVNASAFTVNVDTNFTAGITATGASIGGTIGISGVVSASNTWTLNGAVTMANLLLPVGAYVNYSASRTFSRVFTTPITDGQWTINGAGTLLGSAANPVSARSIAAFVIDDMPDGCTLTTVAVKFQPSGSHVGVPSAPPSIAVWTTDLTNGTQANIVSAIDPNTGSVGAYEVYTSLSVSPNLVIDRTRYKYTVVFSGEGGTNALNALSLYGAIATFTSTKMDSF